ncbi:MAG TPA: alginate lyase, partial [Maribacter sp.]|nr:alginate lyase [Maribacter sp.]
RAETIRIGDSKTRFAPGYVNVSHNYFEACNGEVEIISDKTNFNIFNRNIVYKSEGSLVLRHSNYAKVNGNIFIGGDDSDFYG